MTTPNQSVRGIRQTLPPGKIVGRGNGRGAAQLLSTQEIAQQLIAGGSIGSAGGGAAPASLLGAVADGDVLANITGSSARPIGVALSALLDHVVSNSANTLLYRGSSDWVALTLDGNFAIVSDVLKLAQIASGHLIANSGGSTAEPTDTTLTVLIDQAIGSTQGDLLYRGASAWSVLAPGTAGQTLFAGTTPAWKQDAGGMSLPVNPTGTTGDVMMGLAGSFTPATTGRALLTINCNAVNNANGGGASLFLCYGTGAAPANGDAPTGTALVQNKFINAAGWNNANFPVAIIGIAPGLTLGTPYWIDIELKVQGGGTASIINVAIVAEEF